ncbi:MAG: FkbM family methyltransferase [Anaerolineaceae bacterium]|nr:FkbM family methyltransferase [Anaerolineaceae bacterium]MCB9101799.1 FkbM family methyltransferase [Anaerolineales bacterium]
MAKKVLNILFFGLVLSSLIGFFWLVMATWILYGGHTENGILISSVISCSLVGFIIYFGHNKGEGLLIGLCSSLFNLFPMGTTVGKMIQDSANEVRNSQLGKTKIFYISLLELIFLSFEIFILKEYFFQTDKPKPYVLDVGAHIGLATLYFKKLYPDAEIVAFEPNPKYFKLLQKNIRQNRLTDVQLHQAAVSQKEGEITFYHTENNSGWDASVIESMAPIPNPQSITVQSVKLSHYINRTVDLLKIDIEGAETQVLEEIQPKLKYVNQINIEYHHSDKNHANQIAKTINILHNQAYTLKIRQMLLPIPVKMLMTYMQLLKMLNFKKHIFQIYAYRQDQIT